MHLRQNKTKKQKGVNVAAVVEKDGHDRIMTQSSFVHDPDTSIAFLNLNHRHKNQL